MPWGSCRSLRETRSEDGSGVLPWRSTDPAKDLAWRLERGARRGLWSWSDALDDTQHCWVTPRRGDSGHPFLHAAEAAESKESDQPAPEQDNAGRFGDTGARGGRRELHQQALDDQ